MCCKSDRSSDLFSKKLHCGLKKENYQYGVWKKQNIAISFWDSYKCNFLSNCFSTGTEKRLEATDLYNKYKGEMDIMGLFPNK